MLAFLFPTFCQVQNLKIFNRKDQYEWSTGRQKQGSDCVCVCVCVYIYIYLAMPIRGPLSLKSTIEELLERESSGSVLENQEYSHRGSASLTIDTPISTKAGTDFADKWQSLGGLRPRSVLVLSTQITWRTSGKPRSEQLLGQDSSPEYSREAQALTTLQLVHHHL
jgi:hypothetical protein